jgi:hypothetical protein
MMLGQPLFADFGDVLQLLFLLLFFLIGPLINQMGKAKKAAKQPAQRMPGPVPPRPPQAPQGGKKALEAEIEEFLRQAQKRQPQGQAAQQPQQLRQQRPPRQQPPQPRPPRQRLAEQRRPGAAKPEPIRRLVQRPEQHGARSGSQLGEGVAEHVEQHIKSKPVTDHAQQLGRAVGQADENVESHLHEVFDHQLGSLGPSTAETTELREGTDSQVWENLEQRRARESATHADRTTDIVRLLRSPMGMREAIILGEILKPPKGLQD